MNQIKLPNSLIMVIKTLRQAGYQAYVVGGAVRDACLGMTPSDFDVATNALPTQVAALFPRHIPTGIAHGTITVISDGQSHEVTTYRQDGVYLDGRRPEAVTYMSSIEPDLARRDFTINAMAWDPFALPQEALLDPWHGQDDLKARLIRTVGVATARFEEDGLRLLRAARFMSQLDFSVEAQTQSAMLQLQARLHLVAMERILMEWRRLLGGRAVLPALGLLQETKLLSHILPELAAAPGLLQMALSRLTLWRHHQAWRPGDDVAAMILLLSVLPLATAEQVLQRLKYPGAIQRQIKHILSHLPLAGVQAPLAIRRFLQSLGRPTAELTLELAVIIAASRHQDLRAWAKLALHELQKPGALDISDLAIDGNDVMMVTGSPPGPQVKRYLQTLLEEVWQSPHINIREALWQRMVELWHNDY